MATKTPTTTKNPRRVQAGQRIVSELVEKTSTVKAASKAVAQPVKRKRGQPTKFTPELWQDILSRIAAYEDLFQICSEPGMPSIKTVQQWYRESPELKEQIREAWIDWTMIGHMVNQNIARGGVLSTGDFRRDELLVKSNQWFMSKANRRDFGDKLDVQSTQQVTYNMPDWWAEGLVSGPTPPQIIDGTLVERDKPEE